MNPALPRRPMGITLLALILGWLALAGFANALLAPLVFGGGFAAHLFRTSPVGTATLVCILALAYGITALIAAVGLWRMETWAARGFLAWAIAAVCVCLFFLLSASVPAPWFVSLAFVVFIALLLGAVWSHIGRQIDHHKAELLPPGAGAAHRMDNDS